MREKKPRRDQSFLRVLLDRPSTREIYAVSFAVTYLCQSKCTMCNIWRVKEQPELIQQELSLETIKEVFQSKYFDNLRYFGLTGGEPFLRKDFVDVADFILTRFPNAYVGVPTNSIDPQRVLTSLERLTKRHTLNNLGLCVSLDGLLDTHDRVRGMPGNFKKAIALIENIQAAYPGLDLSIGFTILPSNFRDLLEVSDLATRYGVKFGCQFGQASENYYGNSAADECFKWTHEMLESVQKSISEIVQEYRKNKPIPLRVLNPLAVFNDTRTFYFKHMVSSFTSQTRTQACYSGTHSVFLDARGNVFPCIMLDKKIGNVKEARFDDIWESYEANTVRTSISKKKCQCWTPCEMIHSIERDPRARVCSFFESMRGR